MADSEDVGDPRPERRTGSRKSLLKKAQLVFGSCAVDCILLDISDTGARVRTTKLVPIPDWVRLDLPDGKFFLANRRWTRGLEIGFSLNPSRNDDLLEAMIDGLSPDQKRSLIARIEASLARKGASVVALDVLA